MLGDHEADPAGVDERQLAQVQDDALEAGAAQDRSADGRAVRAVAVG